MSDRLDTPPPLGRQGLILILQVWPGDVDQAIELAKFIVRESDCCPSVNFMVAARFDTPTAKHEELKAELRQLMGCVDTFVSKGPQAGYPAGPNGLWRETMEHVATLPKEWPFSGVLTFEADCIPCRKGWINFLVEEWTETRRQKLRCMGHRWPIEPVHLNGNLAAYRYLMKDHPHLRQIQRSRPWDVVHGKFLLSIGRDTPAIYQRDWVQDLDLRELDNIQKNGVRPAFWHGVKDPERFKKLAGYALPA